jgi:hypothetical protein
VTDLAASELASDLDPVAFLEELDCASDLGVEIALADFGLKPDLLEINGSLMPARFLLAASLFVLELAVIEKPRHRWHSHRRDLDEIQTSILREPEGLARGHDAPLITLLVDNPHLWDADHLVYSQFSTQACSLISIVPPFAAGGEHST